MRNIDPNSSNTHKLLTPNFNKNKKIWMKHIYYYPFTKEVGITNIKESFSSFFQQPVFWKTVFTKKENKKFLFQTFQEVISVDHLK